MSNLTELMERKARETAERAERLAHEELQRRGNGFRRLLSDAQNTIECILSADAKARRAERSMSDDALKRAVGARIKNLHRRVQESLKAIRRDLRGATFRAALVGALVGAVTTAALLLILAATIL